MHATDFHRRKELIAHRTTFPETSARYAGIVKAERPR